MSHAVLEIHTTVICDNVEDARLTGQMVARILGKDTGMRISTAEFHHLSIHAPEVDRSKFRYGGQETDARIGALEKNLRAAFPELDGADITGDVKYLDGRNWTVNYQQLLDNIRSVVTADDVLPRFQDAVALTLRNENLRGVK